MAPTCIALLIDAVLITVTGFGCSCFYTMGFRQEFRRQNGLPEICGGDCFTHCCCSACAFCQEAQEIQLALRAANGPQARFPLCGDNGHAFGENGKA